MTLANFLSIMLIGILTGNVIASSGIGVDLVGNNLNSIRNSTILSLFVFGASLVSGLLCFALLSILNVVGYSNFFIVGAFLIVAIIVQVAEYILEKFFPIAKATLGSFVVTLIPTIAIILFSIFSVKLTFLSLLCNIIFVNLGIFLILTLVAGVRQNKLNYSSYDVFKGNLMTLAVLFVIALVWTAV